MQLVRSRAWRLLVVGVAVGGLLLAGPTVAQAGSSDVTCRSYAVPVALAEGQPMDLTVSAQLCATSAELRDGTTIQVLLHGGSYNRTYWDFPVDGYSYARHLAAAGYPTFAIDQVGAGASSHPPSDQVTLTAAAFVAHQVVQGLRDGTIAGVRFGKIIAVGHSLGSATALQEAISWGDVDGLIVTGLVHHVTAFAATEFPQHSYPAILDPKFAGSGLDPGYLTTTPGSRAFLFYNPADADPAVITADEAGKDVVSSTLFTDTFTLLSSTTTQAIQVPVLLIMGSNDAIFCDAMFACGSGTVIAQQEASFYSPAARLQAITVPGAGHVVALHRNHLLEDLASIAWSNTFVGQPITSSS